MHVLIPHHPSHTAEELAKEFDLPRYSRRDLLLTLGGAAAASLLAGCGSATVAATSTTSTATTTTTTSGSTSGACLVESTTTRGPYFVDSFNDPNDTTGGAYAIDSLIQQRSDIRANTEGITYTAPGVPVVLTVTLYNATCASVLSGARVDIWHCNASGAYSDILNSTNGGGTSYVGQDFLRGYQVSDVNGQVTFTTIYPGAYSGRAPHIHLKIRIITAAGAVTTEATTQLFFTDAQSAAVYAGNTSYSTASYDTTDAKDSIYAAESPTLLPALSGSVAAGFTAAISIGVAVGTIAAG